MENQKAVAASNSGDVCGICHGTGWKLYEKKVDEYNSPLTYASPCPKCYKHLILRENNGIPEGCRDMDLYRFDFGKYNIDMSQMEKLMWNYFNRYGTGVLEGKGLYLWSRTAGSGKTFLACCLAQSLALKYGLQVRFVTAPDYLSVVGESYKRQEGFLDKSKVYRECDLLIFDDIGAQKGGEWPKQELFKLINARMESRKVTLFTSNVEPSELNVDDRTISRIESTSIVLSMPEKSIRKEIREKEQKKIINELLS